MESRGENEQVTHIRDPIYDEIHLSELELNVLDTPEVQRLRQINQLGAVTRVYPSATHTRFNHSLGVMHLAGLMANKVNLSDEEITEARIAGLLHDTGHGPFSHTSEEVMSEDIFKHDSRSCEIAKRVCEDLPVDENNVVDYISGEKEPSIVAGTIDADRLDYLVRDSLFTSVAHGQIDVNSIIRFSDNINGKLGFDEKAIPSINDMLSARLRMKRVVYRYDTVRHLTSLIRRAMEEFVEENTVEDMIEHDDYTMHSKLIDTHNKFYKMLIDRDLSYERFNYNLSDISKQQMKNVSEINNTDIRERIAERINKDEESVLISSPYIPENVIGKTTIMKDDTVTTLSECSDFPNYINREAWGTTSFQVYINNPAREDRNAILEELAQI